MLGWIGVALSGSNTSTNAMFGTFQAIVGKLLGFPLPLLPALNSVGAEIGKPVAPQTASVGVSTTHFVRNEGAVIRHNMGWTFVLLAYLVVIGIACLVVPGDRGAPLMAVRGAPLIMTRELLSDRTRVSWVSQWLNPTYGSGSQPPDGLSAAQPMEQYRRLRRISTGFPRGRSRAWDGDHIASLFLPWRRGNCV